MENLYTPKLWGSEKTLSKPSKHTIINQITIDNKFLSLVRSTFSYGSCQTSIKTSKMAKKRKAIPGANQLKNDGFQEKPASDSKLRVNTYEDVADSEDEFHINRDKILLEEGPAQKRQRKTREEGQTSESHIRSPRIILS